MLASVCGSVDCSAGPNRIAPSVRWTASRTRSLRFLPVETSTVSGQPWRRRDSAMASQISRSCAYMPKFESAMWSTGEPFAMRGAMYSSSARNRSVLTEASLE